MPRHFGQGHERMGITQSLIQQEQQQKLKHTPSFVHTLIPNCGKDIMMRRGDGWQELKEHSMQLLCV